MSGGVQFSDIIPLQFPTFFFGGKRIHSLEVHVDDVSFVNEMLIDPSNMSSFEPVPYLLGQAQVTFSVFGGEAVPEPSSAALALTGLGIVMLARKRAKRLF